MANETPSKVVNAAFFDKLMSTDASMFKTAADAVNDFTRMRIREDGIFRKILPPVSISNDELNKQIFTDKPVKIVEREPGSPGSISVPFATLPMNRYIRGDKYAVSFARIMTPKFTKDTDELRTYDMDIRQIISDNAIKDMLAEEDTKGLLACKAAMGGSVNSTNNEVNQALWFSAGSTLNRYALINAKREMAKTRARLEPEKALTNNITIKEIEKFDRSEAGGNIAEEMLLNGFGERKFLGLDWIITIKHELVNYYKAGTNFKHQVFFFAAPKFLGKFFVLTDVTMVIDRKAFMVEFYAYETIGAAIGNVAGVSLAEFGGDWTFPGGANTTNSASVWPA